MDYSYDIFISYRRSRNKSEWLMEHFLPLFQDYLNDEIIDQCGREARKIFLDQTEVVAELRQFEEGIHGIEPGLPWRTALSRAICESRCMVGLWSPDYFFSEWCQIEWKSFEARRQKTNRATIVPISIHDGKSFPAEAQSLQMINLNDYLIVGEGFRKSEKYVDFQDKLKNLAKRVAGTVKQAPPFEQWTVITLQPPPAPPTIGLTTLAAK